MSHPGPDSDCCESCNRKLTVKCNTCGMDYTCCLKDHLSNAHHKQVKMLIKAMKHISDDDIDKLYKKYCKDVVKEEAKKPAVKKPTKK